MDWGGAQWLVIFWLFMRALLHGARLMGVIHYSPPVSRSKLADYSGARMFDLTLLVVLWWGGFFP